MIERRQFIITAKSGTSKDSTIGIVFNDVADLKIIGGDSTFCVRASITSDQAEDFLNKAKDRGYIAEKDHVLASGPAARKSLTSMLMGRRI